MKKTIALSLILSQLFYMVSANEVTDPVSEPNTDIITEVPQALSKIQVISEEKEKAITQAEQIKIKTIAMARSKEAVAIAKAIKTHAISEIEALKVQALAKADAMAEAETKITQAKSKRMKRKILSSAKTAENQAQEKYDKTINLANQDIQEFVNAANAVNTGNEN